MGRVVFSVESYAAARRTFGVDHDEGVTKAAERQAQITGRLSEIVDPAISPIRRSLIRLDPHQKQWIATLGCPMDIEVSCDTTGSMGGEVDTEMAILPKLYEAVASVLPGYDPQLCLGIFGDVCDDFVMCRPQFEMEAPKIVNYLKEMAPQRGGGDSPEDPQYAMFARAYLTDAYTNRIGLKGYHFIVTDATCHYRIERGDIARIFGEEVFDNELKNMTIIPTMEEMVKELKKKTHQFVLVVNRPRCAGFWCELCGEKSVINIASTRQLPAVISAIIGLTEGIMDIDDLRQHIGDDISLAEQLSNIEIGAQAKLRHYMANPVPKAGDIFVNKSDTWPIQPGDKRPDEDTVTDSTDQIEYL